jgi:hypothetical protein
MSSKPNFAEGALFGQNDLGVEHVVVVIIVVASLRFYE